MWQKNECPLPNYAEERRGIRIHAGLQSGIHQDESTALESQGPVNSLVLHLAL